jgi:4-amino-4-deoxy-L-arabinose transferase-like glycosyltransferase
MADLTQLQQPLKSQDCLPEISKTHWLFRVNLDWLVLGVVLFLLFFWQLGSYPLFDLDEPRYAEAAREMLENGNWITPYFNYELRFDKPVLFYWLIGLAYHWFGITEFAARFFSAFSASVIVISLYGFGWFWIDRLYGFLGAVVLASTLMFMGIARMSITDMTLTCWMTLTMLCLFMVARQHPRWWIAAGLFSGLAILTKGPVGIVLPGGILLVYAGLTGCFKRSFITPWFLAGLGVSALVSVPWYVLAYLQNRDVFIEALFKHNVTRFSDVVSGHRQPGYFYSVVLLAGFLPWSAYLPAALYRLQCVFNPDKSALSHLKGLASLKHPSIRFQLVLFSWVWSVAVFTFFSFSQTRLLTYILPMMPGLALAIAELWHLLATREKTKSLAKSQVDRLWQLVWLGAVILVVAFGIAGAFFVFKMDALLPREAAGMAGNPFNKVVVGLLLLGAGLAWWAGRTRRSLLLVGSYVATLLLVSMVALHGIVPAISQATQGATLSFLALTQGKPLMLYEIQRPSLTFYGRRKIERFGKNDSKALQITLRKQLLSNTPVFVMTRTKYAEQLNTAVAGQYQVNPVKTEGAYCLLSVRAF